MEQIIEADNQMISLLERIFGRSRNITQGSWTFPGVTNTGRIKANIDAGFLTLDSKLNQRINEIDPWEMLQIHSNFPFNIRYAADRHDSKLHLHADLHLREDTINDNQLFDSSIDDFCLAFKNVLNNCHDPQVNTTLPATEAFESDLKEYCKHSRWAAVERSTGELSVKLDDNRPAFRAILTSHNGGDVCMKATLFNSSTSANHTNRNASALLLLLTCKVVRKVRAVVCPDANDNTFAQFELRLPKPISSDDINEGLTALSVACNVSAAEAQLLYKNKTIAESYLQCFPYLNKL